MTFNTLCTTCGHDQSVHMTTLTTSCVACQCPAFTPTTSETSPTEPRPGEPDYDTKIAEYKEFYRRKQATEPTDELDQQIDDFYWHEAMYHADYDCKIDASFNDYEEAWKANFSAFLERYSRRHDEEHAKALDPIVQFLLGAAPLEGVWYGEHSPKRPTFWWRRHLREVVQAEFADTPIKREEG